MYKKLCDETAGYNCSRSLLRQIGKVNANLEIIRKGLEEYLEKKRSFFPRYFLFSDEQLLALFGSVNPNELIPNSIVPVLYRHIAEIRCRPNSKETVEAIVSKEGE